MAHPSDEDRSRIPLARPARARTARAGPAQTGTRQRAGFLCLALCGVSLLGAYVATRLWGVQSASDPVPLNPARGRKGVALRLPQGEIHVLRLLQDFASYIGESVYAQGDIPPTAKITVEQRLRTLDVTSVRKLLEKHNYQLTREPYRGREVYWVQKLLVPPRKKGSLTPSRGTQQDRNSPDAADIVEVGRDSGDSSLCLYRRQDGDGPRYVVLFETNSKEDAEDALSLLEAHQRSLQSPRSR